MSLLAGPRHLKVTRIVILHINKHMCSGISFNQYLTYLPVPTLPSSQCNSSSQYKGHLTSDMICSMANGDSRVCHVSYIQNYF